MVALKIYFIISIFNQTAGVVGPLPYNMKECLLRAALYEAKFISTSKGHQFHGINDKDVKFTCKETETRPYCSGQFKGKCVADERPK
jgi:hypothetical protein